MMVAQSKCFASQLLVAVSTLTLTLTLTGCGKSNTDVAVYPSRGTVTLQGKPLPGAIVALHPKSGVSPDVPNPRATVKQDGSFDLSTYVQADGAPEGEYIVTVHWFRPVERSGELVSGPNVLPKKYAKPETSDIHVQIASGTNELPKIELR